MAIIERLTADVVRLIAIQPEPLRLEIHAQPGDRVYIIEVTPDQLERLHTSIAEAFGLDE